MTEQYDRDEDRARLLAAALDHVAFDGWSETALRSAAEGTGIPLERALNAFPGGATELVAVGSEYAQSGGDPHGADHADDAAERRAGGTPAVQDGGRDLVCDR